jgi:hypothetical protein
MAIQAVSSGDHVSGPANARDKLSANDWTHAVTIALKCGIIDF